MLFRELQKLEAQGQPIRLGVSGAGWMGSGFVAQVARVPGMEVMVLADADVGAARAALEAVGVDESRIVEEHAPGPAMDALRAGKRLITGDYTLAARLEAVDVVVDVTPSPAIGAETAYACIQHSKDVVMVNIEADVTVGRILKKLAQEAGSLYTVSSGDEPGCLPMQRGMVGPEATLETVAEVFALEEDGGIARFPGAVDFVQGPEMAGGVFCVVRVADERIRDDLHYLKLASDRGRKGSYFALFRPYHLWFIEAPISVAQAYLYRERWLVPLDRPVAEVMTVAKRDLEPGERLDEFGGYTFYGVMDRAGEAHRLDALPAGLAPGAQVTGRVAAGEIVRWADVRLDESRTVVRLRRRQDETTDWP